MTENTNTTEIILSINETAMECFRVVMSALAATETVDAIYAGRILASFELGWSGYGRIDYTTLTREITVYLTDWQILAVSDAFAIADTRAEGGFCPWALWEYDITLLADIWWSAVVNAECDDDTWNSLTGEG